MNMRVIEEETVLRAEGLAYTFPGAEQPVFSGVDLSLARGEFVSLVGGSGVGKSTVLRCAAGLLRPTRGTITLGGERRQGGRRRSIVFQDSRLLPWRTVHDNVAYALHGLGLSKAEAEARIGEALELTMMGAYANRWPSELSGGQQQRVGIARALAVHPSVLLMDEPFSAVDAITRAHLQTELLEIWRGKRIAILFVTHDIDEAALLSDRVLVMAGRPAAIAHRNVLTMARPRTRTDPVFYKTAADIAGQLQ
ncbi:MAG TPA: ABC transporter ATP-binding protein [Pararhizobium sp.]|nr:ABC transporter ATP-binding protein [Pararhizobium sp.]